MTSVVENCFHAVVNLFFPRLCAGCGNELFGEEESLCISCTSQLPVTNFHMHANNPVEKIFWGRLGLTSATSYLYFTKGSLLQHLLHAFKYQGNKEIGLFLGRCMGTSFLASGRFASVDGLVPLPLHPKRERKRGYNQAAVICEGIADIIKKPVIKDAVLRPSATQTQTRKSRVGRWKNIEGKFLLSNPAALHDKHILLVDDVVTTGATLESCGIEMMNVTSLRLSIATLAYTSR